MLIAIRLCQAGSDSYESQAGLIDESLELRVEQLCPISINVTTIGGDRRRGRVEILVLTDEIPPTPDACHGKFCGVMTGVYIHQSVLYGHTSLTPYGTGFPFRPI
jgi:hypothetical protein